MSDPERALKVFELLRREYPDVKGTALNYGSPLELLVATILSAQCTDAKVNQVTRSLFQKYRTPEDYADADPREFEEAIKPTGFYRAKARSIIGSCRMIVERFGSQVPRTMEELTSLPGVARKTANVVLSNAFHVDEGVAVDTHVMRLAKRLSFTEHKAREKIEQDLMRLFPKEYWFPLSNLLIAHGRKVCTARKPNCTGCVVNRLCPSAFTFS
ncbi:MAG: endonuclease III [Candidatus Bathyarchaeia archaeon]